MNEISIVIPVYNESQSLEQLHKQLTSTLSNLGKSYEIVFVDDGSSDGSISSLEKLYAKDKAVKIIQLRRNFGKAAALSAGFKYADGKIIITMDADLQDDPAEIPKFLSKIEEGYDLVSGWRYPRHDSFSKRVPSKLFNQVTSLISGIKLHDFNCGFKVYRRETAKGIKLYGELHRYLPVLVHGKGFKVGEVKINHRPRQSGQSKYGAIRYIRGFLDLLTVMFLTDYCLKPLHLFGLLGLIMLILGFIINAYLSVLWFMGQGIGHRPLLLFGVLLMLMGIQFISLGLLGEMIQFKMSDTSENFTIRRILGSQRSQNFGK
ncbi:MAG: glycosyltransferase family 2 protein [Actinomycetota bacterium]|nr:glycosyltransferase family 2 protein [Actinomycetota bacterium]